MAKLSIIIPVYNVKKYIRKCLDSVINQSLQDIEIILVDDGSTDNCGLICDEYGANDKRIIVIHRQNGGVCAALNSGLDAATSEYICFLDSDDFARPFAYETLYNLINIHNADLAISGYDRFKEENKIRSDESVPDGKISVLSQKEAILEASIYQR